MIDKKEMESKKEYEYKGIKYKDRKISNVELEEKGVWLGDIEILPPIEEKAQGQKRTKREISYSLIFGRVYYQLSDLIEFAEKAKRNAAA
ncbi:MAG: hypothetical protein WC667_09090 [Sulfurimonas sp.]|jgi:hypothetical protein